VDMFGPFNVKQKRSVVKRYCALFTCLNSRAVHIEVCNDLSTDSFILALRRFMGRRGNVRIMRSDNGTDFVGAKNELDKSLKELDHEKVKRFLQSKGSEWIIWKFNPPYASHMGGVWERQIRSARRILSSLLYHHGESLNDESLRTLIVETESIVNSRPLTVETLNDPESELPLSPSNLLTMKSDIVIPPPGTFESADIYSRKQWRRIQHLAGEFWDRWRKEFLNSLQMRQKWNKVQRNFKVGDVVLLKDQSERNRWPMGRIVGVEPDSEGIVRAVQVKVYTGETAKQEVIRRPIAKLVLLLEDVIDSPTKEPEIGQDVPS